MARMRLRHVDVLAVALWHGLYSFIFAIFIGVFYCAYAYLRVGHLSTYSLAYYLIVLPLVYCPLGLLAYALVASIYNFIVRREGGITLDLEASENPPPLPNPF